MILVLALDIDQDLVILVLEVVQDLLPQDHVVAQDLKLHALDPNLHVQDPVLHNLEVVVDPDLTVQDLALALHPAPAPVLDQDLVLKAQECQMMN